MCCIFLQSLSNMPLIKEVDEKIKQINATNNKKNPEKYLFLTIKMTPIDSRVEKLNGPSS